MHGPSVREWRSHNDGNPRQFLSHYLIREKTGTSLTKHERWRPSTGCVGLRDADYASIFMHDLKRRLKHRVLLTTDGHRAYLEAVESAFGAEIDYAMLIKLYGAPLESETRYSPLECTGVQTQRIQGDPEDEHISISYAERQNLTMRMAMRRFTRLTNAFSRKVENLQHAVSLHFMYYNFARIHKALWVTPAMEVGISRHVWTIEEMVDFLD